MKKTYYEVVEKSDLLGNSILLDNPNFKEEKMRWSQFKTLEGAKRRLEKAKRGRKEQYTYFRNKEGQVVNKVSFWDEHELTYKIYKYVVEEEVIYKEDNLQEKKTKIDDSELRREMPLYGSPL